MKIGIILINKMMVLISRNNQLSPFFYPVELAKFLNLAMLFLATVSFSHAYPMYIIHKIILCGCQKKIRASPSGVHGYPPNRDACPGPTHPTGSRKEAAGFLCLRFVLKENDLCLFEGKLIWIVEILEVSSLKSDLKGRINSIQTAMQCSFRCSLMMWRLYACSGTTWRNGLAVALRALGNVLWVYRWFSHLDTSPFIGDFI